MNVIELKGLTYKYSVGTPFESTAVDNVDLTIEKGEFCGIIGHTGSGKSTLIQHLNGLVKPTSGEVFIDGQNIWDKGVDIRSIRFKVGLVFQYSEYQLFEETVYKDIAYGPKNMGCDEAEVDRRVREAAENMLSSLSRNYQSGERCVSFLLHSTGHHPAGSEIDASIIYADYYYYEALLRLRRLQQGRPVLGIG